MAGKGSRPGERRGGRKKGVPNKCNQDIRALIRDNVDFTSLIIALASRANSGSEQAAKLLFEYSLFLFSSYSSSFVVLALVLITVP